MSALGIDLVSVERMRSLMTEHGGRLMNTIFNQRELGDMSKSTSSLDDLSDNDLCRISRPLALKFAAKEATVKALTVPLRTAFEYSDITVLGTNQLEIQLTGNLLSLAKARSILPLIGSGSVTASYAMAVIIGVGYD
jgi:phosphopantetheine--protein transferase-like protein